MKFRFDFFYRAALLTLVLVAFWAVWASAQDSTNNPPSPARTAASGAAVPANQFGFVKIRLPENALTFGLDHIDILRETKLLDEPLWKYFASLIYIVLAFYIAKILDFIVNAWLKHLASKTDTKYDDLLLELLRGPVKVVAFVIFLNIGLGLFDWPPHAQLLMSRGLIVVVSCSMTYVTLKLVDLLLGIWREKNVSAQDKLFAEHLFPLIRKAAKAVIVTSAVLVTADNLEIRITSVLAGLSIGGLALGLAAQDTVANLFGAVAIFLDKPFHIGDRVKILSVDGTVEGIGLRSTRVRSLDGHLVTIPNKTMGNEIITNVTRRPTIKTEMNIGLTYDTPVEKVKRATIILEEVFRSTPKTSDLIISFNKFGDSALNLLVVHVWNGTDAKAHFAAMQELNLKIKERFDAEKIEFAYPTQTIFLKAESGK